MVSSQNLISRPPARSPGMPCGRTPPQLCGGGLSYLDYNPTAFLDAGTLDSLVGNGARQFTAANSESLSHADNADLSGGDVDFFISVRVRLDSIGANRVLVVKGDGGAASQYSYKLFYRHGSTDFRFEISDGIVTESGVEAGITPAIDTDYFIFAWHDAANSKIWISVNGSTPVGATASAAPQDESGSFRVGGFASGSNHDGRLSNLAMGKPPTPIAGLWPTIYRALNNNGNKPDLNDLTGNFTAWGVKGAWPLDERSGNAIDISGNSYDLTDNNTVTEALGSPAAVAVNLAANNDLPSVAFEVESSRHATFNSDPSWPWDSDFNGWVWESGSNYTDPLWSPSASNDDSGDFLSLVSTEAWSISFDIKTSVSSDTIPSTGRWPLIGWNSGSVHVQISVNGGKLAYSHYDGSWNMESSTTSINDGSIHRCLLVNHADETMDIFVDGTREVDGVDSSILATRRFQIVQFLRGYNNATTDAKIANVAIYSDAKTQADATTLSSANAEIATNREFFWSLRDGPNHPGTVTPTSGETADASYSSDVPSILSGINTYVWEGDALGRYIRVSSGIIPTSGDFTFIARVKLPASTAVTADYVVVEQATSSFLLYSTTNNGTANGQIRLYVGTEVAVGSDIRDGNVHSIAVVKSGTTYTVYLDGVEDATGTTANVPASGSGYIGADNGTANWAGGMISDVRVYDSALSESAIATIHGAASNAAYLTGGATPPESHLIYGDSFAPGQTITDGDGVDRWNDLTDNDHDFVQTSVSLRPTYDSDGIGGKPALLLNGSSQFMQATTAPVATGNAGTVVAVVKPSVTTGSPTIYSESVETSSSHRNIFRFDGSPGKPTIIHSNPGNNDIRGDDTPTAGEAHILCFTSSGSAYRIFVNGQENDLSEVAGANNGEWFDDLTGINVGSIGAYRYNGAWYSYFNGHIAKLLIWDGTELEDADRQAIESLLAAEYGVALAS